MAKLFDKNRDGHLAFLKDWAFAGLRRMGLDLVPVCRGDERAERIYRAVRAHTITGPERVHALVAAVEYVVRAGIGGALVECGVYKGGSVMAMALTLLELGRVDRDIYLYDTFSGMPPAGGKDVSWDGMVAEGYLGAPVGGGQGSDYCRASMDEVKAAVLSTGYPAGRFRFVPGRVEETIPGMVPDRIAVLRLDTDWYESTRHEMEHLFPLLAPAGVLIVDDYGHWRGAREAVDEYLGSRGEAILLHRIDYSCHMGIRIAGTGVG